MKQILHLSETEVMNITHFQRGNGLISTNNNNITVEFKASALEKELITTDRQELLEILERHRQKQPGNDVKATHGECLMQGRHFLFSFPCTF